MPKKLLLQVTGYKLLVTDFFRLRKKSGLTLVELQIVVAIFGGIALIVGGIYYTFTRLINEENTIISLSSQNKNAIDEMTNQTREAESVGINCTICGGSTASSSTVLILELWPIDTNGTLFEPTGNEYDYMVYRLDSAPNDANLIKEIFPNGTTSSRVTTSKILSTDVKSILFEYDDPVNLENSTEVTMTLTNEKETYVRTHTYSQTSKAILRNK